MYQLACAMGAMSNVAAMILGALLVVVVYVVVRGVVWLVGP